MSVYVVVAASTYRSGVLPIRPLYEGTAPPPTYRWVAPPPDLAQGNVAPVSSKGSVKITANGSEALSTASDDTQFSVVVPKGGIPTHSGATAAMITITPIDPASVGPAPLGHDFDGNAYAIAATYTPSGGPADMTGKPCADSQQFKQGVLDQCATIVMRFPIEATELYRWTGSAWEVLANSTVVAASLQIFANSPHLGTFVAMRSAIPSASPSPGSAKRPSKSGDIVAIVLGAAAVVVGIVLARARSVRAKRRRKPVRKTVGKTGKPQAGKQQQKGKPKR